MENKTPLYNEHVTLNGKMVPFAGYLLPVQYPTGIITEHLAVRKHAGLFDVSHMGEILLHGTGALASVNHLLTNDFSAMELGQVRYSPMCNEKGGIVDDLIVYKLSSEEFLLVVNAANREKDLVWILQNILEDTEVKDLSDEMAQVALQGPNAKEILARITKADAIPKKYYTFLKDSLVSGVPCLISRTGYTGEFGYEIYMPPEHAVTVWNALLEAGQDLGLLPCGLGARDTLRLEASLPLYGHEMTDIISPLEAGLDFSVKLGKDNFIGKEALELAPPARKRVGFEVVGRGIVREEAPLFVGDRQIGISTSGTHAPYLEKAIGMALVTIEDAAEGVLAEAEVRGRRIPVRLLDLPFIKKQ